MQTKERFCFCFTKVNTKLFFPAAPSLLLIPSVGPSCFILGKKAPCNGRSLVLNNPFDFQAITHSFFCLF